MDYLELKELKKRVNEKVDTCLFKLQEKFGTDMVFPTIEYSLRGKVAGQANYGKNKIRLNLKAFELEPADMMDDTVPHEVCHLYAHKHNPHRIKPHGYEWKECMRALDLTPKRCHSYSLPNARKVRRWTYYCGCAEGEFVHMISTIIHNRIKRGRSYRCRTCRETLLTKSQRSLIIS
ncbi:hypothetical protein CMI37_11850 [Candidatus Pacearchaeota archaeon]|nr:hypothetical protein [Candidatus Pacearchaeota archaeon]|tara:strand:+ start:2887 stop:3417 length:531 start_codon:yes stop_codon:yes gene_type:complete